jgi:hypothetical protein
MRDIVSTFRNVSTGSDQAHSSVSWLQTSESQAVLDDVDDRRLDACSNCSGLMRRPFELLIEFSRCDENGQLVETSAYRALEVLALVEN